MNERRLINRRRFLSTASAGATAAAVLPSTAQSSKSTKRLGLSIASYGIRMRAKQTAFDLGVQPFSNALNVLDHCHRHEAGGIQIGVSGWSEASLEEELRQKSTAFGMYLEGQIGLPVSEADRERFNAEILAAKEAGVTIFRTVMLNGRRYETFDSEEDWKAFEKTSWQRLQWAEPIVAKAGVKLAVENHKDWRIDEFIAILERLSSPHVGINLDTGNNIALLENPLEVVKALAPFTMTTHLKDMRVESYEDGFLLAEVPLGQGFLDLRQVISICERHNAGVQFNLEMITRDPLKIPCLTDSYWTTFGEVKGEELAEALRTVREHQNPNRALQAISKKGLAEQIEIEEANVRASFAYARQYLNL